MLQTLFGFDPTRHEVRTEIYAGITTFLTMAYILAVNPGIFSALEPYGMPTSAVFTATVLASVVGSLVMALYAKKPFGLAPGMGINAFFVYTVCLGMGYTWQFALTAVFIEGILFILLSLFKIREQIANAIPDGMKAAIGGGIGLREDGAAFSLIARQILHSRRIVPDHKLSHTSLRGTPRCLGSGRMMASHGQV